MELVVTDDREYIEALLRKYDLPTADLGSADLFVAYEDAERIGCGGFGMYSENALFRSIAVEQGVQNRGYGREIVRQLRRKASERGARGGYLLTTTAAEFFEQCGFEQVEREVVPETIRETKQFTKLCPNSAVCMRHVP